MKYSEAKNGRTFIIRLDDGEIIHEQIENFAKEHGIKSASVIILGGINKGSILIVGPEDPLSPKIKPMELLLDNAYECTGTGTIFPNSNGIPILHLHLSAGRKDKTVAGCVRRGVKTWLVLEVIINEIVESTATRKMDSVTGFELLEP